MSKPERRTITCPECGEEIEFTLWASINTEIDFAINDIISGKLFDVECKSCGHTTRVDYPMLFNDMIHHVMISYERPGEKQSDDSRDSINVFSEFMSSFYKNGIRIVDSQNKLREKVSIFNAGLDDHVIEIYKYSLIVMFLHQNPEVKLSRSAYYCHSEDEPQFQLIAEDGNNYFAPFDEDLYEKIEAAYSESRTDAGDDGNSAVVDYEWAQKYIEDHILSLTGDDMLIAEKKLNRALEEIARLRSYESFLREVMGGFTSLEEFLDDTRARMMADAENIDLDEALEIVKSRRGKLPTAVEMDDPIVQDLLAAFESGILSSEEPEC